MFPYYGGKSKIVKFYPAPVHNLIIEPFAGAAWYSLLYKNREILLNEKYNKIYEVWKWLTSADKQSILDNRDFVAGQDISNLVLPQSHKDLIGFCINRGSVTPKSIVQRWSCQVKSRPNWASTTHYSLTKIANSLDTIKHFNIKFGSYHDLDDVEATWFIDPPYQFGGEHYVENKIDYTELAEWCKSRKGQVIVCENSKADWLPFRKLVGITGQRNKTEECIWTNE